MASSDMEHVAGATQASCSLGQLELIVNLIFTEVDILKND